MRTTILMLLTGLATGTVTHGTPIQIAVHAVLFVYAAWFTWRIDVDHGGAP